MTPLELLKAYIERELKQLEPETAPYYRGRADMVRVILREVESSINAQAYVAEGEAIVSALQAAANKVEALVDEWYGDGWESASIGPAIVQIWDANDVGIINEDPSHGDDFMDAFKELETERNILWDNDIFVIHRGHTV